MTPAPCAAPPTLPCRPGCRGWYVEHETGLIQPCVPCDEWVSSNLEGMSRAAEAGIALTDAELRLITDDAPATADDQLAKLLQHFERCRACADLAVMSGAREPILSVFEGINYELRPGGWVGVIYSKGAEVVATAPYAERADAREAGMAWLRRLRGQPW